MDFTTSSDFMTTPLTPLQLHELHLMQQQDDSIYKMNQSHSHNQDISMDNTDNTTTLSNNSNHGTITADSIFWENNYTSQHLPMLHNNHSQLSPPQSDSISPTLENDLIDGCIKKEIENDNALHNQQDNSGRLLSGNMNNQQQQQQQQPQQQQTPEISEEELYLRRKAQNRALQRLFRERKESKLKELSSKLSKTELEKEKLVKEIDNLRKQNTVLSTKNQVLLKSGAILDTNHDSSSSRSSTDGEFSFPVDKKMFINDFIGNTGHDVEKLLTFDKLVYEFDGSNMMTVGAIWDYLHEYSAENEDLEIDVNKVMNLLKGNERCHGYGPGYPLELVERLIEDVTSEY